MSLSLADYALLDELKQALAELQARVEALEAKRGPGRPPQLKPKDEAA